MTSIYSQLREYITDGVSAEDAAAKVVDPFTEKALVDYARPYVLRDARQLERRLITRPAEKSAFTAGGVTERAALRQVTFRLHPSGQAVTWGQATREQHEARIAWARTQIAGLEDVVDRHEQALKLLAEHGVDRLDDIPDWTDLLAVDDSEEDETGEGASGELQ